MDNTIKTRVAEALESTRETTTPSEEEPTANLPATPTWPTATKSASTEPHIAPTQELRGRTQTTPTPPGTTTLTVTPPPTPTSAATVTIVPTTMPPPTPELGSTPYITPTPTFEEQFRRPTAEEPIPEWAHQHLPALTEYLLEQPWVTDTLTAFELHTVELLLRDGVSQANAIELAIEEGLLSGPDPFAMDIIQSIHGFGSAPEVTDPKQIQVEHRTINLPLRGQTNLLILRAQPGSKVSMDLLENAVKEAERFMDVPFPTDQVTLEFTKGKDSGHEFRDGQFKGDDWSGKVQVNPMHDQHALVTTNYSPGNEKRLAEVIAHEVAHYYWNHHITWIDEGMAETLMSYI